MLPLMRVWSKLFLIVAGLLLAAAPVAAQLDNAVPLKLKKHLPHRQYRVLGEKAVGVLVHDAKPVLDIEGRFGPKDQLCFSHDGLSYRWVYVPTDNPNPMISNLQVPIGKDQDGGKMVFDRLNVASPKSVQPLGVTTLYTLVEVEVNNGAGSPPGDSFAATKFRVLEGSKEYPLKVGLVLEQLKKDYANYVKEQQQQLEAEMAKAQEVALKDKKPTGPRSTSQLMYVTWITADSTLQVRFLSKINDGHFYYVEGKNPVGPNPLPIPPNKKNKLPPGPIPGPDAPPPPPAPPGGALVAFPPPPPPRPPIPVKVGTRFGVEFGRIYTVSKEGKITQTQNLECQAFSQEISPPPGFGIPAKPLPLPVLR
jgi:hypothetical protein